MFVYKVIENIDNYYSLILTNVRTDEVALEQYEHTCGTHPEDAISKFMFDRWDDATIEKTTITPRQFLELHEKSGAFYESLKNDTKCMNVSNAFEAMIVEKKKKGAKKTEKPVKEPKPPKVVKPKAKKSSGVVKIENGQILNFNE
jgi:hypothetical protein